MGRPHFAVGEGIARRSIDRSSLDIVHKEVGESGGRLWRELGPPALGVRKALTTTSRRRRDASGAGRWPRFCSRDCSTGCPTAQSCPRRQACSERALLASAAVVLAAREHQASLTADVGDTDIAFSAVRRHRVDLGEPRSLPPAPTASVRACSTFTFGAGAVDRMEGGPKSVWERTSTND